MLQRYRTESAFDLGWEGKFELREERKKMKWWERGLIAGSDEACQLGLSGIGIGIGIGIGELAFISCFFSFVLFSFVVAFLSCCLSFSSLLSFS